jgi:hypothetical protein
MQANILEEFKSFCTYFCPSTDEMPCGGTECYHSENKKAGGSR